jgi:predicted transport protein
MSDIKLFKLNGSTVTELEGQSVAVEKSLQTLIEKHLNVLLGVRFLATEYSTGKTHKGRIDTLGIDENGCPVIVEYKRSTNENVINQGLFYLNWLLDHKAEFELLVLKKLGQDDADGIEWASPRLLCIAGDFTKYDAHAVQQINRSIELLRYKRYGDELLLLELVNAVLAEETDPDLPVGGSKVVYKTVSEYLADADTELRDRFESLRAFLTTLGDDVQMKTLKHYIAFTRIKNFACTVVHTQTRHVIVWVKLDPASVDLVEGFTRDVSKIGHHGTGDVEITIRNKDDLEKAKPLLLKSYEAS